MADHGATSSQHFIYDVFLSFRGDTRHAFTDHLYHALTNKGINTFRDDPNLRLGDEITPTLLDAIERSRMSIVVLSQEYASSPWCLVELVKIMDCSDNGRKRPVLPIFYQVEPSDVRHQKNQYKIDMMKHENRYGKDSQKVKAWRSALSAVADLSGKHCKDRSENDIIKEIVGEVLEKLPREPLHIPHPFELDSRFQKVTPLLDIESQDTLYLCIHGDGETDKTSFVGALYNKIRDKFQDAYFLENVSQKACINGMEDLQKRLLSMIDHKAKNEMGSIFRGCSEIKRRLEHKRVLLVLDDVDSVEQLDSLAGKGNWFGRGSRIIITTSDEDVAKHVLDGADNKTYRIDESEIEGMEASKSNKKRKMDAEEGDVVGFEDSLDKVINQLKEVDSLRNVVSITGMGGLGKTTLAQKIYNNREVKKLFPCRAWSFVSKEFSGMKVLLSLLRSLKSSTSNKKYEDLSEEELKAEVKECLKRRKYLVVLDDIWETEVWDKINNVFPDNNNGSMILITSRYDAVARYTRSRDPHHQLPLLNNKNSWKLFCRKVFGKEECPFELEPIGRSIVERCGGLPLAIITLAGLVAKKERSHEEWSQIKDFVPWYLAEDPTKVMDVLKVSYDNLPEKLKPCFLYFGIYPEDYEILARDIIQLWIAEGFIAPEKTATSRVPKPEDVGYKYLKELVDRNLIQVAERRSGWGVKKCRIHDLLRELCILESKADNFLDVCTESTNNSLSNSCRLSLLCDQQYYTSLIKCSQPSTRSLFFFDKEWCPDPILKYFPLVQVLHVARQVSYSKYPCDLTMMSNLKYLRLSYSYSGERIPDWIWSLYNLETLDLRGSSTMNKTMSIWKLEQLRHLYISIGTLEEANSKQMWKLQTLSRVEVEPQTMLLLNSGSFPNLTKLGLFYGLSSNHLLHELCNLRDLSNLRTFEILCCPRGISFDRIVFPSSISKITLRHFDVIGSSCMSALGRISSLRILKLAYGRTAKGTLNCGAAKGDFPQLRVFHIAGLRHVKRLTIENGAMPRLQRVVIHWCSDLQEVPEWLLSLRDESSDWRRASNL